MTADLQPELENELVSIRPLRSDDFEALYAVASDPLLWEQHPNPDRYRRDVFEKFFEGAMASRGALIVYDKPSGEVIGSSRFYDYNPQEKSVLIGYTFIARSHWGGQYNPALKRLMLGHAFQFTDRVYFHIGAMNIRSQRAIERLGAVKTGEIEVAYYGEPVKTNFVYCIEKSNWLN